MDVTDGEGFVGDLLECRHWVLVKLVFTVFLKVDSDGRSRGSSSRLSEYESRAICVSENPSLIVAHTGVNWVRVAEDLGHISFLFALEWIELAYNSRENFVGRLSIETLVIVSLVIVSSVFSPVFFYDLFHSHEWLGGVQVSRCKDLKPAEDGPNSIFFSDVRAAGTEALLSADRDSASIKQVAEEFPACWRLIVANL